MATLERKIGIVVPCYNEEFRLSKKSVLMLAEASGIEVLLVDDGSKDRTLELLKEISESSAGVDVLALDKNGGKGEAVRKGLLHLLKKDFSWVGYVDADFSTPASEILRLVSDLDSSNKIMILAARVRLLGYNIRRKMYRHYLGRVFATLASLVLRLPVYDTQCGCKLLKVNTDLRRALSEAFLSRWVFDVELIARLLSWNPEARKNFDNYFEEVPLHEWQDVDGSKLSLRQMAGAFFDLAKIFSRYR